MSRIRTVYLDGTFVSVCWPAVLLDEAGQAEAGRQRDSGSRTFHR